jgi:hypothetical protein
VVALGVLPPDTLVRTESVAEGVTLGLAEEEAVGVSPCTRLDVWEREAVVVTVPLGVALGEGAPVGVGLEEGEPRAGVALALGLAETLRVGRGEPDWEARGVREGEEEAERVARWVLEELALGVGLAEALGFVMVMLGVLERESLEGVGKRLGVRAEVLETEVEGVLEVEAVEEGVSEPRARVGVGARLALALGVRVELLVTVGREEVEAERVARPVVVGVAVAEPKRALVETVELGEAVKEPLDVLAGLSLTLWE